MGDEETGRGNGHGDPNLRNFVSQEFRNQRLNNPDGNEVSDDRAAQFLQRALSESNRMSAETSQAERRQKQLYAELGKERFEAWTQEHMKETDTARGAAEEEKTLER